MATYKSDGLRIATYANGIAGRGISEIKNYYYASSSANVSDLQDLTENDWKEKISDLDPSFDGVNKYLWNYEKISYTRIGTETSDPQPTITDPTIIGTWGKGFENIYEYYIITNTDSAPDLPQQSENGTWPDQCDIDGVGSWIKEKTGVDIPKPTRDKPYLWNYEILNFNDATDQYFGPTCIGTYGNSISTTVEYYCATSTRTPVPSRYSDAEKKTINTDVWKTDIPSAGQGATTPFLWNFERTSFSMDDPQDTDVSLISSEPRVIKQITEYYQKSATKPLVGATQQEDDENHNQEPTIANGWGTVKPDLDQGETLWNFEVIEYQSVDSEGKNLYSWTEPSSVGYMGLDGVSFTGISRRYKTSTTEEEKPTDGPDSEGFSFDSWGYSTPSEASFSETNKYLWMIEEVSFDKCDSDYTPIELSAIWSQDGRQYEQSKYFYLVNNSAGSYDNVDVSINETTGEPSENTAEGAKWKDTHGELSEGQALWVAEYQKFSRPATGQTKVWEPLPVRLLSYVGTNGLSESGVSLTTSSYIAKSTDTSPIQVERNLYGDAIATDITWEWYVKVGSLWETEITSTDNTGNIYTTEDKDDIYIKAAAFGSADTIQVRIAGTKTGNDTPIYQDYVTLKLVADGSDAYVAFLTNPHASISADKDGNVASGTQISTNIVVLKGSVPQNVTLGTVSHNHFNINVANGDGSSSNPSVTATVKTVSNKINLGSVNSCSGVIDIPITSPINQTLQFNWTKTNTGAPGAAAVIYEIVPSIASINVDTAPKIQINGTEVTGFYFQIYKTEGSKPSEQVTTENVPAAVSVVYQNPSNSSDKPTVIFKNGSYSVFYDNIIDKGGIVISIPGYNTKTIQLFENGPSTNGVVSYAYLHTNTQSVSTPDGINPNDTNNNWKTTDENAQESLPYVFRAEVTTTTTTAADGTITRTTYSWSQPTLYKVWNNKGQSQTSYADYCRLTSFGTMTNYDYDDQGRLIIQATTLAVGEEGAHKFYASVDANSVSIGGWQVNGNMLYSNDCFFNSDDIQKYGYTAPRIGVGLGSRKITHSISINQKTDYDADGIYVVNVVISVQQDVDKYREVILNWNPEEGVSQCFNIRSYSVYDSNLKQIDVTLTAPENIGVSYGDSVVGSIEYSYYTVTSNPTFAVTKDGSMYATKGKIGGWELTDKALYKYGSNVDTAFGKDTEGNPYYSNSFGMQLPTAGLYVISVGSLAPRDWQNGVFKVRNDGSMYATKGEIGGWTIGKKSIEATNTQNNIDYHVIINSNMYTSGNSIPFNPVFGIYVTQNGSTSWPFMVRSNGRLVATDASITGTINAREGGKIGGFDIGSTSLNATSGYGIYIKKSTTNLGLSMLDGNINFLDLRNNVWSVAGSMTVAHGSKYIAIDAAEGWTWKIPNSFVIPSDVKVKTNITCFEKEHDKFFDYLLPRRYRLVEGNSGRYHFGFVAQEVCDSIQKANLTTQDVAAYVEFAHDEAIAEKECGLRYEEFISLNTWQIQKLKPRMTAAETKIASLELEISQLKTEIQNLKNAQNSAII